VFYEYLVNIVPSVTNMLQTQGFAEVLEKGFRGDRLAVTLMGSNEVPFHGITMRRVNMDSPAKARTK
jgi:hypothetical protein